PPRPAPPRPGLLGGARRADRPGDVRARARGLRPGRRPEPAPSGPGDRPPPRAAPAGAGRGREPARPAARRLQLPGREARPRCRARRQRTGRGAPPSSPLAGGMRMNPSRERSDTALLAIVEKLFLREILSFEGESRIGLRVEGRPPDRSVFAIARLDGCEALAVARVFET